MNLLDENINQISDILTKYYDYHNTYFMKLLDMESKSVYKSAFLGEIYKTNLKTGSYKIYIHKILKLNQGYILLSNHSLFIILRSDDNIMTKIFKNIRNILRQFRQKNTLYAYFKISYFPGDEINIKQFGKYNIKYIYTIDQL